MSFIYFLIYFLILVGTEHTVREMYFCYLEVSYLKVLELFIYGRIYTIDFGYVCENIPMSENCCAHKQVHSLSEGKNGSGFRKNIGARVPSFVHPLGVLGVGE